MPDDDAELVALIDNELDDSNRTALWARLAADERLRQRYEAFRQTGAPLAASLDELLTQAPLARLRAALPAVKGLFRNPPPGTGGGHGRDPRRRRCGLGRVEPRTPQGTAGLALVGRRIYESLHERDLRPIETGCNAAGKGAECRSRQSRRQ